MRHPARAALPLVTVVAASIIARSAAGAEDPADLAALTRDCDAGEAAACGAAAEAYLRGRGVAVEAPRALALFGKACDAGHHESCRHLGVLYERSPFVAPDRERARALFRKACEGGNAAACGNLAVQYESDDEERALALYLKACEMGNVLACHNGAQFLRRANDAPRALGLLERGCALGGNEPGVAMIAAMACDDVAREREAAGASAEERAQAKSLRERALGLMHEGCEASGWACRTLAGMYERGERVPADPARASEMWSRYAAAVRAECEAGIHQLCGELAGLYAEGKGVPRDPERARQLRERTAAETRALCEQGQDADSCYALAQMYERGEGLERSVTQAIAFFSQACRARHEVACGEERRLRQANDTK